MEAGSEPAPVVDILLATFPDSLGMRIAHTHIASYTIILLCCYHSDSIVLIDIQLANLYCLIKTLE